MDRNLFSILTILSKFLLLKEEVKDFPLLSKLTSNTSRINELLIRIIKSLSKMDQTLSFGQLQWPCQKTISWRQGSLIAGKRGRRTSGSPSGSMSTGQAVWKTVCTPCTASSKLPSSNRSAFMIFSRSFAPGRFHKNPVLLLSSAQKRHSHRQLPSNCNPDHLSVLKPYQIGWLQLKPLTRIAWEPRGGAT